jgi:hypothetical protein
LYPDVPPSLLSVPGPTCAGLLTTASKAVAISLCQYNHKVVPLLNKIPISGWKFSQLELQRQPNKKGMKGHQKR